MKVSEKNKKYYFSVEGGTEKLYLEWFEKAVNSAYGSEIEFKCDICKPTQYLKRHLNHIAGGQAEVIHFCDYEGRNDTRHFFKILSEMKTARLTKNIDYKLAYCNFTFELWLILHKMDCYTTLFDRTQYLAFINKAYGVNFRNLHDYKAGINFKKYILHKLTLDDVHSAINRAKFIMNTNKNNGYTECEYKGYKFYTENPSLSIFEHLEKILPDNL